MDFAVIKMRGKAGKRKGGAQLDGSFFQSFWRLDFNLIYLVFISSNL